MSHLLTVLNSSINFYIYLAKQGVAELRNLRLSLRDPEETEMVRVTYVKFRNSLRLLNVFVNSSLLVLVKTY